MKRFLVCLKQKKIILLTAIILVLLTSCENPLFLPPGVSEEEYNIISETNKVRTTPGAYANMLETELAAISNAATRAKYEAAISTLRAASPRSPVKFEMGLYIAARDHAKDLIKSNTFSHDSSDGTPFSMRIYRYGTMSYAGENIAGGTMQNTGAKFVKQWVLSPGHLSNILNEGYTQLGAAFMSGHPTYNWLSVQDFARDFRPK